MRGDKERIPLKVYIDLLIFINLCADFLLLWMTGFWRRRKLKWWRLLLGSMVGTSFVLLLFIESLSPFHMWPGNLLLYLLMSLTMILITFGNQRISVFCQDLLVFYMVTFCFGGGLFVLNFILQSQEPLLNGFLIVPGSFVVPQGVFLGLFLGFLLMIILSRIYFQVIEVGKRRSKYILQISIWIHQQKITVLSLLDTGNQLYEPLTRIPVMILEVEQLAHILPEALFTFVKKGVSIDKDLGIIDQIPLEWQTRLRMIPFRSVGKGNQLMLAVQPDRIEIYDGQQIIETSRVRIGLTNEKLTADSSYFAILHPALIPATPKPIQKIEEVSYVDTTSS